jgi:hypothetical protein
MNLVSLTAKTDAELLLWYESRGPQSFQRTNFTKEEKNVRVFERSVLRSW